MRLQVVSMDTGIVLLQKYLRFFQINSAQSPVLFCSIFVESDCHFQKRIEKFNNVAEMRT
jgi:hypothetical protein